MEELVLSSDALKKKGPPRSPLQAVLLHENVPRLRDIAKSHRMPGTHRTDVFYAYDAEGTRWVVKEQLRPDQLIAEALGWLLSRRLGVLTPDAGTVSTGDQLAWASRYVDDALHWSAERANVITNVADLGGMIALDALVWNPDRHDENILCTPVDSVEHVTVHSIDFEGALAGDPVLFDNAGLKVPDPSPVHPPQIPVDLIEPGALALAARAERLDSATLSVYVQEACALADDPNAQILQRALRRRLDAATQLVRDYLDAIKALQT